MKISHCKITGTYFVTFEKDGQSFASMGSTRQEAIKDLVISFNKERNQ